MEKIDHTKYVEPRFIEKEFGISTRTLFNYGTQGKIKFITKKDSDRRFYDVDSAKEYFNSTNIEKEEEEEIKDTRENICYIRTSLFENNDFLSEQMNYFKNNFPEQRIIYDICNNFKESNLFNIVIEELKSMKIKELFLYNDNILPSKLLKYISIICRNTDTILISINSSNNLYETII